MYYIYKFTNKLNKKTYIGQTNNVEKRKRGHKSESFNSKATGYFLPFHCAIRKYGWENFDFEILEEIPEDFGHDYVNEREIFFIEHYKSLKNQNGYNISLGGQGCSRKDLTFQDCVKMSKLFNEAEVRDIQEMLLQQYAYYEILNKYPQLTSSFLSNINVGLNFKREDLTYPLSSTHSRFSRETRLAIIEDITAGIIYAEISAKYGVSLGFISAVNNGNRWKQKNTQYPLCQKSCANGSYSKNLKYDLIFGKETHDELAQKYKKAKSTVTAINVGRNRKDNRLLYPLRTHQKENQKIWNTLF